MTAHVVALDGLKLLAVLVWSAWSFFCGRFSVRKSNLSTGDARRIWKYLVDAREMVCREGEGTTPERVTLDKVEAARIVMRLDTSLAMLHKARE